MFILDKILLTISVLSFSGLATYFLFSTALIVIELIKFIFKIKINIEQNVLIIKNLVYFIPLLVINIVCIFLFLFIFCLFSEIKSLQVFEVYYYLRYICHPKTIATVLYYVPLKDYLKFSIMIISFIIISNIYEFISTYKVLAFKYKHTNEQFHMSDKHVRQQIVSSLILLRVSDIMSNHQILVTDASSIVDIFQVRGILTTIIEKYDSLSADLLDEKFVYTNNASIIFYSLGIIELVNIIIYMFLTRVIKNKFI